MGRIGIASKMYVLKRLVAPVSVLIATVLVALPWGMSAENQFLLPLLALAVIYHSVQTGAGGLPEWVVFCTGLSLDILTNAPIGFWALLYLLAYLAGVVMSGRGISGLIQRSAAFAFVISGLVAAAWVISSLYYARFDDWRPYVTAAVAAALFYPLIAALLPVRGSSARQPGSAARVARG